MFVLNSDITIGGFRFSGVNDVRISCSMHSIVTTAVITIPAQASVLKNGQSIGTVVTGNQFKDGDPVVIKLGYNGTLQTEFKGFVKSRDLNTPLQVTCEGYSWLLRRNKVNISKSPITIKALLDAAIAGIDSQYPITIKCELDCELNNVQINGTGFDVISKIAEYTDGNATCFFIAPDVLWCGLLRTPYATGNDVLQEGEAQYRLGYNIFKDNTLKQRTTADDTVQVTYSKKLSTGAKLSQQSDAFKTFARTHSRILNQIKNAPSLKALANEKAHRTNYKGYEGNIQTFLVPFVAPGHIANLIDNASPDKNGTYLVESVETHFGISGARRTVELGIALNQ